MVRIRRDPSTTPSIYDTAGRAGPRRLFTIVAVIVALLVGLVAWLAISARSGSIDTAEDGTLTLELAMLAVPIAEEDPILENPDQFLGVPHQRPTFDTSSFGPDLSFRLDTDDLAPLEPDVALRSVYLGHDQAGEPYYIWHVGSPDFRQMLGQVVADFGSFGRFGSSYGSLETGGGLFNGALDRQIEEMGLTTGSLSQSNNDPATLVAEWHGLPAEVAAVVFYWGGEVVGWQIPVSGTAALRLSLDEDIGTLSYDIEMVALTSKGEEWNRYP